MSTPALQSFDQDKYSSVYTRADENTPVFKSWSKGVVTETFPTIRQNCSKLMEGDSVELKRAIQLLNGIETFSINANFSDCSQISQEFNDNFYISESEKTFPIAFVLIVHSNVEQILRFLKVIYRPQNLYCIHPDPNSGTEFTNMFKLLSHCLPNIFLSSHVQSVKYYHPNTIFEAQMSCFKDLDTLNHTEWRYAINLCGRELPLKTNRHIVEDLRKMNGTSIVKIRSIDKNVLNTRFHEAKIRCSKCPQQSNITLKDLQNNDDFLGPNGIKIYKTLAYNALSRSFIKYILHNNTMQQFTKWILKYCTRPEEYFYSMAYMIPGAPGGFYTQVSPLPENEVPLVFHAHWKHNKNSPVRAPGETCLGKVVHQVCILNSAELPRIKNTLKWNVWFFNKYFMEDDHVVMDCVEEELVKKNKQEFLQDQHKVIA